MIKKPLGLLLTGVLTLGLAACNNNGNDAAEEVRTGMVNRDNNTTTNVRYNTANRLNNNPLNVGNGRDDGIDHNGLLTEDYTNNDNNDSDIDRGRRIQTNNVRYNTANRLNDNRLNVNYNRDYDITRTRDRNRYDNDMNISADQTSMNSSQFPHTKAVLIQDAKYRFIPFGSVQWFQFGGQQGNMQQGNIPNQQLTPTVPTPGATAPTAPVPAPAPAAPAPAAPKTTTPAPTAPKTTTPAPAAPKQAAPAPTTGDVSSYVKQVIDLTNAQRSKNGLPALKADAQLSGVAQKKSVDMQQNNYFSHTSPTYGSPFDMMRDFGVTYKSAGENIAQGQRTPQEVVNAWMNSEGHRRNILSTSFTHIGVGYEKSGNHWTQMFIGK